MSLSLAQNVAAGYGASVATAPSRLGVEAWQEGYVPGSSLLNFTLVLWDAQGQEVRSRRVELPHLVMVLVCAEAARCTQASALQPAVFLPYASGPVRALPAATPLRNCVAGAAEVTLQLSLVGAEGTPGLQLSRGVACEECEAGQSSLQGGAAGVAVRSCETCLPSHYCADPRNQRYACEPCPAGATCPSGECAVRGLRPPTEGALWSNLSCPTGPPLVGEWALDPETGTMRLRACASGFLLVNASVEAQRCRRCEPGSYSFDFLDGCDGSGEEARCPDRECAPCPLGAECGGGDAFAPAVAGSLWRLERVGGGRLMRCRACPPGYVLVRSEDPAKAALDLCVECPPGTYSVTEATHAPPVMLSPQAELAPSRCEACSPHGTCPGGNALVPKAGFWMHWSDRAKVNASRAGSPHPTIALYPCPVDSCKGGVEHECFPGRDGALCGLCAEGFSLAGSTCRPCGDVKQRSAQSGVLAPVLALLLLLWFVAVWRPFFSPEDEDTEPVVLGSRWLGAKVEPVRNKLHEVLEVFVNTSAVDMVKILISFAQVVSTFEVNYSIAWPVSLTRFWGALSLFRLDWQRLPGLSCLSSSFSYLTVLQASTVAPFVVSGMLWLPAAILWLQGKAASNRFKKVVNSAWYCWCFFFFLSYPFLAAMAVETFNCVDVGSHRVLKVDVSVTCPADDRSSTFFWGCLAVALYPAGIPLMIYATMRRFGVPHAAQTKIETAVLQEMTKKYLQLKGQTLFSRVAQYVGGSADSPILESRAREMFDGACGEQASAVSADDLVRYLERIGIESEGRHEEELQSWMISFDDDRNGTLEWEEFLNMVREIVAAAGRVTGLETVESIDEEQLDLLGAVQWDELLVEDEGDGSGLKREIKKRLKREGERKLRRQQSRGEHVDGSGGASSSFRGEGGRAASFASSPLASSKRPGQLVSRSFSSTRSHPRLQPTAGGAAGQTREKRLRELIRMGRSLIFSGVLALPVVRWNYDGADALLLERIGMLFDSYAVQFYYFEQVEMGRKFLMTSVVIFLFPGSPQQAAAGLFITVCFLILFLSTRPYVSRTLNRAQALSLSAQAATLFYGLMLAVREASPERSGAEKELMRILVLLINAVVFAFPLCIPLVDPGNRQQIRTFLARLRSCGRPAEAHAEPPAPGSPRQSQEALVSSPRPPALVFTGPGEDFAGHASTQDDGTSRSHLREAVPAAAPTAPGSDAEATASAPQGGAQAANFQQVAGVFDVWIEAGIDGRQLQGRDGEASA